VVREKSEMTDEEMRAVSEAITILHQRFGGTTWEIEVGEPVYDPADFRPYRELKINGQPVEKLPTEV
jgi:hypothetical protein